MATRSAVAVAVLVAGLSAAPAGAAAAPRPAAPKPTSPAARQAPYAAVAHKVLLKAPVKAKATASFRVTGLANVPATASAVVVSISVPKPIASGTLTFFSYGTKRPATVSLAYAKGLTATATVVLIPGNAGKVSVYNGSAKGDKVVATVLGFYAPPGSASAAHAKTRFVPLVPKRVAALVLGKTAASFRTGVPATGVAGVVLSVTVPAPDKSGSLSLYGFGAKPGAADFSFTAHHPASSLVVVPVGSKGRVSVLTHAKAPVRVWVDVVGYLHQLKVPSAPRSIVATAQNSGALITWSAPAATGGAPVSAYRLEVLPGGTTMVVPGQALQTSVGGLKNGTTYTVAVVAMNSVGSGPSTVSSPVVPYGVPAAPTNVVATASGLGTATLTWTAPTDSGGLPITGYRVMTTPGGTVTTASGTSLPITGLASGQAYSYAVETLTAPGVSLPSTASNVVVGEGISRVLPSGTTSANDEDDTAISANARFVVFDSDAALTLDDKNMFSDVYLRDRLLGTTTLLSVPASGTTGANSDSFAPSISADGRFVVFQSGASNLVSPSTNHEDVYLRDVVAGTTTLLSVNAAGHEADGGSDEPVISADGSTVAFESVASDLSTATTNGHEQVFVENRATRVSHLASQSTMGATGVDDSLSPSLSSTGRYVAFASKATNLTTTTTGGHFQVFVNDATTGITTTVSQQDGVTGGDHDSDTPSISGDGQFVAFASAATNLLPGSSGFAEIYVRNTSTGGIVRASVGVGGTPPHDSSSHPILSADGRYVAYSSDANNLVAGDTDTARDVFRTDTAPGGTTSLLSIGSGGAQPDGGSNVEAMTADGLHVAIGSAATNLVSSDTNGYGDLFVRDLG